MALSQPRVGADPSVKGLNFFGGAEQTLSRQLKCIHVLGLIKEVANSYRYYLTRMGRSAIAAACSLTRFDIVPAMAAVS